MTPEQLEALKKQKQFEDDLDGFNKGFLELQEKFSITIAPVLVSKESGIYATFKPLRLEKEAVTKEAKTKKHSKSQA